MNILITGCAGFIGYSFAHFLLNTNKKINIVGIDLIDNYYSVKLKKDRLKNLQQNKKFIFYKINLENKKKLDQIFKRYSFNVIFHFAAQAGVRYSFVNPDKYIKSNYISFFNVLDLARRNKIKKFFFASSSSIYGDTNKLPVLENHLENEKNIYALSKVFNEKISKIYSEKYNMNICGLRFFTVYGEWGRPDMFMLKYINASLDKKKFTLYNYGNHKRDFTYIQDVLLILKKLMNVKIKNKFEIINVCSSRPIRLDKVMQQINKYFKEPKILKKKRDFSDVLNTHGSNKKLISIIRKIKFTPINKGIYNLCKWYKSYKKSN